MSECNAGIVLTYITKGDMPDKNSKCNTDNVITSKMWPTKGVHVIHLDIIMTLGRECAS